VTPPRATVQDRFPSRSSRAARLRASDTSLVGSVDPRTGIDAAVDRVLDLGGWVDTEPYDSELGRIARVTDPSGASFALIDPTARILPELAAGSARVDDPYDD
jgi:hypothetical protein